MRALSPDAVQLRMLRGLSISDNLRHRGMKLWALELLAVLLPMVFVCSGPCFLRPLGLPVVQACRSARACCSGICLPAEQLQPGVARYLSFYAAWSSGVCVDQQHLSIRSCGTLIEPLAYPIPGCSQNFPIGWCSAIEIGGVR